MKKLFKVADEVMLNKIKCQIIDIVEEDEVIWYEIKPADFISFSRYVQEKDLVKVVAK